MAYEVLVSEAAGRDTDDILMYLIEELGSKKAATDFIDALDEKYAILEEHPYVFELSRNERLAIIGYHRFVVGSYVVLYLVNEDQQNVVIARIFHGRREYERLL